MDEKTSDAIIKRNELLSAAVEEHMESISHLKDVAFAKSDTEAIEALVRASDGIKRLCSSYEEIFDNIKNHKGE